MALRFPSTTFTIASGGTSGYVEVEDFPITGLLVPTLTSGTLQIKVSMNGTDWFPVQDGEGIELLDFGDVATTGAFAVSSRDMADAAGYRYISVTTGAGQLGTRTFTLCYKRPMVSAGRS